MRQIGAVDYQVCLLVELDIARESTAPCKEAAVLDPTDGDADAAGGPRHVGRYGAPVGRFSVHATNVPPTVFMHRQMSSASSASEKCGRSRSYMRSQPVILADDVSHKGPSVLQRDGHPRVSRIVV